jgi:S1-C subfamily serine protease
LTTIIGNIEPGTTKKFTVIRYGREESLNVRIDARDTEENIQGNSNLWPGIVVSSISQNTRERIEIPENIKGIIIGSVVQGSAAETAGFKAGDIITKVNNKKVESVLEFYKEFNRTDGDEVPFRIYREGREILLGLVH